MRIGGQTAIAAMREEREVAKVVDQHAVRVKTRLTIGCCLLSDVMGKADLHKTNSRLIKELNAAS